MKFGFEFSFLYVETKNDMKRFFVDKSFVIMTLIDIVLSFAAGLTSPEVCAAGLILTSLNVIIFGR